MSTDVFCIHFFSRSAAPPFVDGAGAVAAVGLVARAAADAPPDIARVAALEWLPIELLLALGVTPLAVADVHNYNLWVAEPKLPATVVDVGQRTEPNLELLQQLQPSLVLLSQGYGPTPRKIQPIAQP